MSTDRNSPPLPSPGPRPRRSSFAGQTFADLFGGGRSSISGSSSNGTSPHPGPITSAAAQAHRRMSVNTNMQPSTSQQSPLDTIRSRAGSISSAGSASVDESPFEDGDGPPASSVPTTPFGRRLSFGARALREMSSSNGNASGNANGNINEGFNFAENMRTRAQRGSISSPGRASPPMHQRAKSVAIMEPPVREIPPQPKRPDAFQERILKGDFYMD